MKRHETGFKQKLLIKTDKEKRKNEEKHKEINNNKKHAKAAIYFNVNLNDNTGFLRLARD